MLGQKANHVCNIDSANYITDDFDLIEFIGLDDFASAPYYDGDNPHGTGAGDELAGRYDDVNGKDIEKRDSMYTLLQYNELVAPNSMYAQRNGGPASEEMSGSGFMSDDRYTNPSLLNSAVSKLHLQHQQIQPSTSRLSATATPNGPPPTYASAQQQAATAAAAAAANGRMRATPQQHVHHHAPPSGTDLAETATSLLSPLSNGVGASSAAANNNSMYMAPIKAEPNYEMANERYGFDSTSDTESHYSHGGTSNGGGPMTSNKPRKYRIKSETERSNPMYRAKRSKNNEAVRRSREKAKQQQQDKERRLVRLENDANEREKREASFKKRINELEKELVRVRSMCSCGAATPYRH